MGLLTTRTLIGHLEAAVDTERSAQLLQGTPEDSATLKSLEKVREFIAETPAEDTEPESWLLRFFEYSNAHIQNHAEDDEYGGGSEALLAALALLEASAESLGVKPPSRR